jgi:hypothetical protein
MSNEVIVGDYRLRVEFDELSCMYDSPREWDNLGTFITWDRSYRSLDKNEFASPEVFMEWWNEVGQGGVLLPVFKFEHSVVKYSTRSFNDPWDSGQVGFIYSLTNEDGTAEVLRFEVETYSQWANGEVYYFNLERKVLHECGCDDDDWDLIESCGGFIGGVPLDSMDLPAELIEAASKLYGVLDTRVSSK